MDDIRYSTKIYNYSSYKAIDAKYQRDVEMTKKCKCGHSLVFENGIDKVFCTWCGHYCYKDKQTEFKYKMMEEINARRIK